MKRSHVAALVLSIVTFTACVSSGTGTGELTRPGGASVPVVLEWHSDLYNGGTMTASLPNGEAFQGKYLQVTHQVQDSELAPMWEGWDNGWSSWPYGNGTAADNDFTTVYTGHVVATLKGPGGHRLRCRFTLAKPGSGMAGGGLGECQSKTGTVLEATFPPH